MSRTRSRQLVDAFVASRRPLNVAFLALVAVMVLHESEHVAQLAQKDAYTYNCASQCRGLLGFVFDLEWVHFAYNSSILAALVALWAGYRMWEPRWRDAYPAGWALLTLGIVLQGYHVVEHSAKLAQWLGNGHRSPTPGLLGRLLPAPDMRNFSLIELHFTFNTAVLLLVVGGYLALGLHRGVFGERRRVRLAIVGAATLVFAESAVLAWAAGPPVVHLDAGVHRGPLVITRTQMLVGRPGAVVRGGIVVRADDVTIRNVSVEGGENGIVVDGADRVLLDDVAVSGSLLDGIKVRDASVTVRDCRIEGLRSSYAQGVDISFSMDRPPSLVERCRITGGQEAIVTHSAHTVIRGNSVGGTSLRGITMTEMSMGRIAENHVADAVGVGIFCGDHSMCEIDRNRVTGIRPDAASADGFRQGFGIVSHFYADATLSGNRTPSVRAFANGVVEHDDG